MQKYKVTVAYDGTAFQGFQVQPKGRTVQEEIEKSLQQIARGQFIRIHPSGRTDAGVHAHGQVFHFTWPLERALPAATIKKALNVVLPADIQICYVQQVEESFHARYDAKAKKYIYRVKSPSFNDPFTRDYMYHHPYPLDIDHLKKAMQKLEGTHDFTGFSSAKSPKENKVRTIYHATVDYDEKMYHYTFIFVGDGFLYHMVRMMMGVLIRIGDGREDVAWIDEIFSTKYTGKKAPTAPARGLYLEEVYYDERYFRAGETIRAAH
ncbi:tRNA pseudouridine(38-40) synthase TruA [Allofustis seminis]|uniref:tRNA pseudouridine(38-40) synthase TruA n=1 Tax=Allofustis seminis TaxID=166939 RepID=UPI0003703039|nr:tRNA pseudouridine(38-40) synthase TruA [Allofustis seminis]